jgi:acyl-lipid omega-6 desaturase (Delta-12 desaturase)
MEMKRTATSITDIPWQKMLAPYQHSDQQRSVLQLVTTLLLYVVLWVLMVKSLALTYWLTTVLVIFSALILVRIFIIFHDCGHGSFFKSRIANRRVGFFLGVLTFTPSEDWWHAHSIHHATAGNLDKRGTGDVTTLTVDEYRSSSTWTRLTYRIFRHPLAMFLIGPIAVFMVGQRFPSPSADRDEKLNVLFTDLTLAGLFLVMGWVIGYWQFAILQLSVMWLAALMGIWLFYVQHQFENVYWRRSAEWNFTDSAMLGASCYRLPAILEWFTGNIGYHHIHHLSPRIPNYYLKVCFLANPELQKVNTFSLRTSLSTLPLRLWDEKAGKMVTFGEAHKS